MPEHNVALVGTVPVMQDAVLVLGHVHAHQRDPDPVRDLEIPDSEGSEGGRSRCGRSVRVVAAGQEHRHCVGQEEGGAQPGDPPAEHTDTAAATALSE